MTNRKARRGKRKGKEMTTLMLEHIKASELPAKWAEQLHAKPADTVTVRIEIEQPGPAEEKTATDLSAEDPLFGIWRDHLI